MLKVENVSQEFQLRDHLGRKRVKLALKGVSLALATGEILGIAGESGSGKTTLAKVILRLLEPSSGTVYFQGRDVYRLSRRELFKFRRQAQIVQQNPDAALDPLMTVEQVIAEPLLIHRLVDKADLKQRVVELLKSVNLNEEVMAGYSHQLSSGQRQRVAIARALALMPQLVIYDEPVAFLDAHLRLRLLKLLLDLRRRLNLSYIFISHDLAVLRLVSDRIAVMRNGVILETAPTEKFFAEPVHVHSRQLISNAPS